MQEIPTTTSSLLGWLPTAQYKPTIGLGREIWGGGSEEEEEEGRGGGQRIRP